MRLKDFGRTGRKVSEVGMGTYYDPLWLTAAFFGLKRGAAEKVLAIEAGISSGMTLVDTAEIYGSEPLVGKAISKFKRDEIFLATKVWPFHLRRGAVVKALEKSLKRLGVSYVDLYQVHWPNPVVPIRETMAGMEDLIRDGKILHVGVSNFSLKRIEEANSALPKSQLSAVQLSYNLAHRDVEKEILPYCDREKIALLAYYPLDHGRLVLDPRMDGVSSKYRKTRSQTALRWLTRKENVFPIPRASRAEHVRDNAGASDWDLSDQDSAELETGFS